MDPDMGGTPFLDLSAGIRVSSTINTQSKSGMLFGELEAVGSMRIRV